MNNPNIVNSEEVDLLVVEDDQAGLKSIIRVFQAHFARVFSATRTDEGLTIIEQQLVPNSLVISDHHNRLSPYHGATLASLSESVRRAKHIPFYLISGGLYEADAAEQLAEIRSMLEKKIIDGFLEKPIAISLLMTEVFSHYKAKD